MGIFVGTNSADTLIGTSSADSIYALDGNDLLDGGADSGNDWLDGGAGDDTLLGGGGDDVLIGGAGIDDMMGGAGNDLYYVDNVDDQIYEATSSHGALDIVRTSVSYSLAAIAASQVENLEALAGAGNINITGNAINNYMEGNEGDNIIDGGAGADVMLGFQGNDTYIVDNVGDAVYETNTTDIDDSVISSITYVLNNSGTVGIENLTLSGTANINGTGNALDNFLYGNSGNNVLDGSTGVDTMFGSAGDDTYYVDNEDDAVYDYWNQSGEDYIYSSVTYSLDTFGSSGVESLHLTGSANINCTGNALDNLVFGNSGHNTLNGLVGADTMIGQEGDDIYYVDNVGDLVYDFSHQAGYDTVYSSVTLSLDTYGSNGVEDLELTGTANIDATGNALSNALIGNSGNNLLDGKDGDDYLFGLDGDDVLDGGEGHDWLYGGNNDDLIAGGNGADRLYGQSGDDDLVGGAGNDTLIGDVGDDILIGEDGNDSLSGGSGLDMLAGDAGNDTLNGGVNADTYFISGTFGSDTIIDTDSATINYGTGANCDVLNVLDVDYDHLWFKQVGSNLEISVVGAANKVTVQNWFTSANNRIEIVNDGSGHVLQSNQVASLVSTMASFSPQVLSGNATLTTARDTAWI